MDDSGSPAHVLGYLRHGKKKKEKRLTFQRAKWKTKIPATPSREVPEMHVINSFTPLVQATDMQTDDSPTTQNRIPPVMVNIEDQNAKDITNLIGSEFGNRLYPKIGSKASQVYCTSQSTLPRSHNLSPK
ncbi:hypothetical protein CEXT_497051 [Caerostris extrusa]|uniref:Uncharacterized protein n=1 Tax=Caerostris extrusa TaxID=172846 RepID=A0AAV4V347_CAEEX|nr:hypothetical protein CEXT_497051 [Caerostris extrusa]